MLKTLKKECSDCGKSLEIIVHQNKSYSGGKYFGKMNIPYGKGKYVSMGKSLIFGKEVKLVKWTGKYKRVEYWVCNSCKAY